MYDLVTKCFYDKTHYDEYKTLKKYRRDLLQNDEKISVTDFGAGSRVFKTNERRISLIAKHVGISEKRAKFLFRLARYLKCREILELGTSLGIGTAALAINKEARVTSIEGCPETAKAAHRQLEKFRLNNVNLIVGEFSKVLEDLKKKKVESEGWRKEKDLPLISENPLQTKDHLLKTKENDLIYFDGHHTKEATLKYFKKLLPTAHNDSVFVFDDIHWSAEMEEAWEIIKNHPSVKVSIDTFYLGLIFFRKEQAKQHFTIRL